MVKIRCWSRGIIFQLMQDESFRDQLIVLLTVCSFLCLYDPMDYSCLGSSVHGIFFFQARILEFVAISSSKGSS